MHVCPEFRIVPVAVVHQREILLLRILIGAQIVREDAAALVAAAEHVDQHQDDGDLADEGALDEHRLQGDQHHGDHPGGDHEGHHHHRQDVGHHVVLAAFSTPRLCKCDSVNWMTDFDEFTYVRRVFPLGR